MKITNKKVLFATVASAIALVVLSKLEARHLAGVVAAGSYVVVAILFAFAAMDYRVGTKNYANR